MKRLPKKTFNVRFPPKMIEDTKAIAEAQQLLPSELVRKVLQEYLDRRKSQ